MDLLTYMVPEAPMSTSPASLCKGLGNRCPFVGGRKRGRLLAFGVPHHSYQKYHLDTFKHWGNKLILPMKYVVPLFHQNSSFVKFSYQNFLQ